MNLHIFERHEDNFRALNMWDDLSLRLYISIPLFWQKHKQLEHEATLRDRIGNEQF